MEVLENTESICPECFRQDGKINKVDAQIIKEDGKIYIRKKCMKHGEFKSIVFSDAKVYEKWERYKVTGEGPKDVNPMPLSGEELYPKHYSQSVLTNLFITNRCNLRCSYCFANSGAEGFVYNPSLDEIRKMLKQVREEKPVPSKALQITGGEPTIRDDLFDIIEIAKELGFSHIQLNTNGIRLSESAEYCRKLRDAGINTIYMSFDGLTKDANPWVEQHKQAVENCRKAGLGLVLVPVVIKDMNLDQLGDIVQYAKENVDVVRGVNFQPISFTGRITNITDEQRKKERVDYVEAFESIEKKTGGQVTRDDFYPVPFVYPISKLVETLKGERQVEFTANPKCGGATYVFVDNGKLIPITRFIDVEGFMQLVDDLSKKKGVLKKARIAASMLKNASKYIDSEKAPEGLDMKSMLVNAITRGSYGALGKFHHNSLYIGTMWFQDVWNLNLDRLKRCVIHYTTEDGVVPFCAYNGFNIGTKLREKHSMSFEEWEKRTGKSIREDLWKKGPIS
jgi:uncharacterized radical SAM superfamily Fe-S cluster-containing enzyme